MRNNVRSALRRLRAVALLLSSLAQLETQASPSYHFYIHSLNQPKVTQLVKSSTLSGLGSGWSSDNNKGVGQCLQGGMDYVGTPSASVSMDSLFSYDDAMEQLGLKMDGNFSFVGFNADFAGEYSHLLSDTDFTQTFVYRANIFLKNRRFVPPADHSPLTWIGQQYADDSVAFRVSCGDKFVSQQQIGGLLYVAVKFQFRTQTEKTTFNNSLKGKFSSFAALSENLLKAANSVHQDGDVSVAAFQIGGDPTKLGLILGAHTGSFEVPVLNCSLTDAAACKEMVSQILVYASQPGEGNFPSQFMSDDVSNPIGPGVLRNELLSYTTVVPVKLGPSLVTQDIIDARAQISQKYEQAVQEMNEVNAVIDSGAPLSADYADRIKSAKASIAKNNLFLQQAGQVCYEGDLSECLSGENMIMKKLQSVDLEPFKKRILALGVGTAEHFFPYSSNQFIFGNNNRFFEDEIFTVNNFTQENIDLSLPGFRVKGSSQDGGLTYQIMYHNYNTNYYEKMTLIPDFKAP